MIAIKLTLIVFIVVAFGVIMYRCSNNRINKWVLIILSVLYLFIVLSITLIGRQGLNTSSVVLLPGYNYRHILDYPWFYAAEDGVTANIGNVIMFVPLGMIFTVFLHTKHPFFICGIISCAVSLSIEIIQYFTQLGAFETDDVIHNTWGALIGCGIALVLLNKGKSVKEIIQKLLPLIIFVVLIGTISIISIVRFYY